MLSRCRRLDRLLLANAPADLAELLALGPPAHVLVEMARLERLEVGTLRRAAEARRMLGWPARPTEGTGAAPPPPPPPPPVPPPPPARAPACRGVVHLWDFLPSDATVQLRALLRGAGWEVRGVLEQLQTSSECGYIAAALAARARAGPLPPTDAQARQIAVEAIAKVEEHNAYLAGAFEEVPPEPVALSLELGHVLALTAHLRNGPAAHPADWELALAAADFSGAMSDFPEYLDEAARAEVAELREGRRQASGILRTGSNDVRVTHFAAFHVCHSDPERPERGRPAAVAPADARPRKKQRGLAEFFPRA
jgi:hypothetical protein